MKTLKSILIVSILLGGFALMGCNKGPMEKAGEKIDKGVEKTGDAIKDAVK